MPSRTHGRGANRHKARSFGQCIGECAGRLCAGATVVAVAASDLVLRSGPARLPGARDRSLGWLRLGIHGQGGACIAVVSATFVVSVDDLARIAAWTLPTLIGVPLLELWYRRAATLTPQGSRI
jgi:hypothetical protein